MARERQSTYIDDYKYEMTMLAATPSYKLFHRLFRMLGPSFGTLVDVIPSNGDLGEIDFSGPAVTRGIQALTENVKETDLEHLITQLKGQTHVGVEAGSDKTTQLTPIFEVHFQGQIGSLFKWIYWGLTVQYGNFQSAFASMMPQGGGESEAEAVTKPQ